jgi:hypothetical protein
VSKNIISRCLSITYGTSKTFLPFGISCDFIYFNFSSVFYAYLIYSLCIKKRLKKDLTKYINVLYYGWKGGDMINITFVKSPKDEKQYCIKCHQEVRSLQRSNKYMKQGYSHVSLCCKAKTYFAVKKLTK